MLQGKIIPAAGARYCVQVGSIVIDITNDVRALIEQETARLATLHKQELAAQASVVDRYRQITGIIFADAPKPTA